MLNVCVVSLSQPSSRVVINVFGICYMLNVCVLSRYLSPVVEWSWMSLVSVICKMFVCVVSLSQPSSKVVINVFIHTHAHPPPPHTHAYPPLHTHIQPPSPKHEHAYPPPPPHTHTNIHTAGWSPSEQFIWEPREGHLQNSSYENAGRSPSEQFIWEPREGHLQNSSYENRGKVIFRTVHRESIPPLNWC